LILLGDLLIEIFRHDPFVGLSISPSSFLLLISDDYYGLHLFIFNILGNLALKLEFYF